MVKKVAVLGSTGSIGRQALEVLQGHPDQFQIFAIAARSDVKSLAAQVQEYRPSVVCVSDESAAVGAIDAFGQELLVGSSGLVALAGHPLVDMTIIAIPGSGSLVPTWTAVSSGKQVGLASKEAMVMLGPQLIALSESTGATIFPIDSELGSIWRILLGKDSSTVSRVFLTCSGGPLRNYSPERLDRVSLAEVLQHPNWSMGKKITVDSATLVNKGLEIIETHYLFGFHPDRIKVLIHPQSYVHAIVEYLDGTAEAVIAERDMRLFIQSVLTYPYCRKGPVGYLNWGTLPPLTFYSANLDHSPALQLAYEVCRKGGTYPVVYCSANTEAIRLFLDKEIRFRQIIDIIDKTLELHQSIHDPGIEEVLLVDEWARSTARLLAGSSGRVQSV